MQRLGRMLVVMMLLATGLVIIPTAPVVAAGTIGSGTAASCTDDPAAVEAEFDTALAGGGLVEFDCGPDPVTIVLTGEKIIDVNTVIDGGGVVTLSGGDETRLFVVEEEARLELRNITLTGGNGVGAESSGVGGAIRNAGGTLIVTNSRFTDNTSQFSGGGISNVGGTVTITNSTFDGNESNGGGAVFNGVSGASLTIIDSTFSNNRAAFGGALDNTGDDVNVFGSTFSSNVAVQSGGAIESASGPITVVNTTLSGNIAQSGSAGGVLISTDSGVLSITNSTLYANRSSQPGGSIWTRGTVNLRNSIIARGSAPGSNCAGAGSFDFNSLGYNLSDDATCGLDTDLKDLPNTNPMLAGLADNGGPTQTHMPGPDSLAIDHIPVEACAVDDQGNILPDQRGFARPFQNGCDIGSVEVDSTNVAPAIEDVDAVPDTLDEGGSSTITVTATDPDDDDDDGTLEYEFDCDGDGDDFEIGPQDSNQTTCSFPDDGVFSVGVRVSDSTGLTDTASVEVTVANVAPTIALSGETNVDEGSLYTLTLGTVTDPGDDTVTQYIVHWDDGTTDSYATAGQVTHRYADGPDAVTITVDLTDEDGTHQAAGTLALTIANAAPAITGTSAVIAGAEVVVTVTATDPADAHDTLSYAFDCDHDGEYEVETGLDPVGQCPLSALGSIQQIGVRVSDEDGGVTESVVNVAAGYEMCADLATRLLREAPRDGCGQYAQAIDLPYEWPLSLCADRVTGLLRLAGADGACARTALSLTLPDDGPITVCVYRQNGQLRLADSAGCSRYEIKREIGSGALPPPS